MHQPAAGREVREKVSPEAWEVPLHSRSWQPAEEETRHSQWLGVLARRLRWKGVPKEAALA